MKKTIIKITVIFLILFSYCTVELIYLNTFINGMTEKIVKFKRVNMDETVLSYSEISSCFERNEALLSVLISKKDVEKIRALLGKIYDQISFEELINAKVTAGELSSLLLEIKK